MTKDLQGRRALVLGGSNGLGLACAAALAAGGADVTITSRDAARAEAALTHLTGSGHSPFAVDLALPVDDPGGILSLVDALEAGPRIDILVLNSGGPPPGRAAEVDSAAIASALRPLLLAQVAVVGAILPGMTSAGWGRVVAIGSSGVQQPIPTLALSNIGRAALAAYLKSLAADVAGQGVTVNMVLPGRIATRRVASLDAARAEATGSTAEEVAAASRASIPANRYGDPAEFAAAVRFLCSPAASYVTGEQLRADGGMVGSY